MQNTVSDSRRRFLLRSALVGAGTLSAGAAYSQAPIAVIHPAADTKPAEEEVSPVEDLMREHGVLRRILLIWEESAQRLEKASEFPATAIAGSAKIIRAFIEDYHEKLEEEYVFPRFKRADQQVELVTTLKAQHDAGRLVTDRIMALATEDALKEADNRATVVDQIRAFVRMYRPHAAREDTVLFPALHEIVPDKEYKGMGDVFELREHELFGEKGFEGVVAQVAKIEQDLGIFDLAQFTPKS